MENNIYKFLLMLLLTLSYVSIFGNDNLKNRYVTSICEEKVLPIASFSSSIGSVNYGDPIELGYSDEFSCIDVDFSAEFTRMWEKDVYGRGIWVLVCLSDSTDLEIKTSFDFDISSFLSVMIVDVSGKFIDPTSVHRANYNITLPPGEYEFYLVPLYGKFEGTPIIREGITSIYNYGRYSVDPDFPVEAHFSLQGITRPKDIVTAEPMALESYLPIGLNYILTKNFTEEKEGASVDEIDYFDGIGRKVQNVKIRNSPQENDIVISLEYDILGRESHSWLPIQSEGNDGKFIGSDIIKRRANSVYRDSVSYTTPVYEKIAKPLLIEKCLPGELWRDKKKSIKTFYLTNKEEKQTSPIKILDLEYDKALRNEFLVCNFYQVDTNRVTEAGNYNVGELYVTQITDEDENVSYEFTNKLNQVVLTRQIKDSEKYDTYYVYDDFGNLCYVLPPLIQDKGISQDNLDKLAYQYKYDNWNRCILKKFPGVEPIQYIYDKTDQLIFTQDGEQKNKNEWTFSIPDIFERIVLTGICESPIDIKDKVLKAKYTGDESATNYGYAIYLDDKEISFNSVTYYSVNYYDNYNFKKRSSNLDFDENENLDFNKRFGKDGDLISAKGQLTGSIVATFDSDNIDYLHSAMYYDNRDRLIQMQSTNHVGGKDSEYIAYDFIGNPLKKLSVHERKDSQPIKELYEYSYDHAGRLINTWHQLDDMPKVLLNRNEYDELGRLQKQSKLEQ